MWIDTHCHLDAAEFDADRARVHEQTRAAGVRQCVIPAVHVANFASVRTLAHAQGDVYALGIHPLYTPQASAADLTQLEQALQHHQDDPRLVAVGEIGLDGFVPSLNTPEAWALQQAFYTAQLRLAQRHGLPVILHVRKSADPLLKGLRTTPVVGGYANASGAWTLQYPQAAAGTYDLSVRQTDAAGNVSTVTSKTVTMATEPLATPVTFDAISGDNKVSLAEQTSNLEISGHGPSGASLSLALIGKSGAVDTTATINSDGVWRITLTPADMAVLGQGEVAVRASARNADDQSTSVATLSWALDAAEPSPSVGQVSGNAIVNSAEALAGVALAGTGVVGHVVFITITGANLSRLVRSVVRQPLASLRRCGPAGPPWHLRQPRPVQCLRQCRWLRRSPRTHVLATRANDLFLPLPAPFKVRLVWWPSS